MISSCKQSAPRKQTFDAVYLALISALGEGVEITGVQLTQARHLWMSQRVRAGLAAARVRGVRFGRPRVTPDDHRASLASVAGLSDRTAARQLGVARSTVQRWRALLRAELKRQVEL